LTVIASSSGVFAPASWPLAGFERLARPALRLFTQAEAGLPWNDMAAIKRHLDLGAQTLLNPQSSAS
jgi:hypothetical protein